MAFMPRMPCMPFMPCMALVAERPEEKKIVVGGGGSGSGGGGGGAGVVPREYGLGREGGEGVRRGGCMDIEQRALLCTFMTLCVSESLPLLPSVSNDGPHLVTLGLPGN